MSTYAEAAASSGPTGAEKLPLPPSVKSTSQPLGGVELVSQEELDHLRADVEDAATDAVAASKKTLGEVADITEKDADKFADDAKSLWSQCVAYVGDKYAAAANYVRSRAPAEEKCAQAAYKELQNPAVLGQLALVAGAVSALCYVNSEKTRIRTDNKYVVAIHAAVITALVVGDVYVFRKLYRKSKK